MHSYSDEGIVLKRLDVGESDRILTIYTKNHGKQRFVAKGVRKITSKRSGSVELFNHIKLHAIQGKGERDILGEIEVIESYSSWKSHLGRVTLAYQLVETVDKLTPDQDPNATIFDLLKNGLTQIAVLNTTWEEDTKHWILEVLKELGYWSDTVFTGDIHEYIETVSSQRFQSNKLLNRIRS